MYYNIELINEKTKETILYEDVQDLNEGEKMYFNFQINAQELKDGEYKLNVIDGDGNVVASDTLNVGEFDVVGIQHKRGENVYINTTLNAKTEANDVEIRNINSTIFPSGDADAMTSVFVRARPVYNDGFQEGYDNGHTDGYNSGHTDGFAEGKTEGYNEGKTDGIAEGIETQKNKLTPISITENGTYSNENGYNELEVNVKFDYKFPLPNGISFIGSTFTDFPVQDYDWSTLYSTPFMFADCKNLNAEPIITAINDDIIPTLQTNYMFADSKVSKIEGIDFTKFYECEYMFESVIDLEEVRNCIFPTKDVNIINTLTKFYRLIDCDFNKATTTYNATGWYFARFQKIDKLKTLSNNVKGCVAIMECDCPSTLRYKDTYTHVWYDTTKYNGWDATGSISSVHPYGFYYNVISQNPITNVMIKSIDTETKLNFEQIIPYNEEKGCYYTDYPYFMNFDVYVNNTKYEPLRSLFNMDIYIPSNELGVYEGGDVKYLIYYTLNSKYFKLNENGLYSTEKNSTNKQKIYTPSDVAIFTVKTGSSNCFFYVTKNGERTLNNVNSNEEKEITIYTFDCDYIEIELYNSNIDNTFLKKIQLI